MVRPDLTVHFPELLFDALFQGHRIVTGQGLLYPLPRLPRGPAMPEDALGGRGGTLFPLTRDPCGLTTLMGMIRPQPKKSRMWVRFFCSTCALSCL